MEIRTIGIDLGKTVFHFVGVNARGEVVVRKKGARTQLLRFTSNLRGCLEQCRRLVAIPGIGPITATATVAAIGNGAAFKKGRGFSAWLGVVPGEHSTGGKQKLTGTSKRGNKYLRKLFVQGAHTVLLQKTKQSSRLSTWLVNLTSRKRPQVATVALANKMARIAWAVLFKGEAYRPPSAPQVIAA
jgi:transposase